MTDAPEFAVLASLLAAIADPTTYGKRLAELRRLEAAVAKEQTKLGADRDAIAADREKIAAAKAELADRVSKLAQRELAARGLEVTLRERAQALAASRPERFPPDPNLFGTITREPVNG